MPSPNEINYSELHQIICTWKFTQARGLPNFCKCERCLKAKDAGDALKYYRENHGQGEPSHSDPFPKG